MTTSDIAKVCHETNRAYCEAIGDASQKSWKDAAEWQRKSAISGVEWRLAHSDAPASAQHDSWLEHKRKEGWKHGPFKDSEKKEHPCFVPYAELPEEQKAKDALFTAVVFILERFLTR